MVRSRPLFFFFVPSLRTSRPWFNPNFNLGLIIFVGLIGGLSPAVDRTTVVLKHNLYPRYIKIVD